MQGTVLTEMFSETTICQPFGIFPNFQARAFSHC